MKIILITLLIPILSVQGDDLAEDPTDILKTLLGQPQELENLLQKYGLKLNETVIKYGNQEDKFFEIVYKIMELGRPKDNFTEEEEQDILIATDLLLKVLNDQFSALDGAKLFDLVGLEKSYIEANNSVDWLTADKICSENGGKLEANKLHPILIQFRNSSFWILMDNFLFGEIVFMKSNFRLPFDGLCTLIENEQEKSIFDKIFTSHMCLLVTKYVCERKASSYQYNLIKFSKKLDEIEKNKLANQEKELLNK